MDGITIETPATEESDEIATLWVRLAEGQVRYGSHLEPEANRQQIREAIVRHIVSDTLLVARADDIVGFVMFTVENGGYDQRVTRGVVENLYVEPPLRNEGIGAALLERAEQRLVELGADRVALEVMADNRDARRFYRDQGYDPHRVELEKSVESDTHSKGDE